MKQILALFLILFLVGCSTKIIEVGPDEMPPVEPETVPVETPAEETTRVEPEPAETTPTETVTAPTVLETTHTIEVKTDGFEPDELTIAVGDTVIWKNMRSGNRYDKAFIIGTLGVCRTMKSSLYSPDEEFSHTFSEAGKCTYVDGVYTTMVGKITVE